MCLAMPVSYQELLNLRHMPSWAVATTTRRSPPLRQFTPQSRRWAPRPTGGHGVPVQDPVCRRSRRRYVMHTPATEDVPPLTLACVPPSFPLPPSLGPCWCPPPHALRDDDGLARVTCTARSTERCARGPRRAPDGTGLLPGPVLGVGMEDVRGWWGGARQAVCGARTRAACAGGGFLFGGGRGGEAQVRGREVMERAWLTERGARGCGARTGE